MFTVEENLELTINYNTERDSFLRFLTLSPGIFVFVECIRNQIPEVNLLQLVPGFYLVLLFISLFFVFFLSSFFLEKPFQFEKNTECGMKTIQVIQYPLAIKFSTFFFF
jgi:hypothetical protein